MAVVFTVHESQHPSAELNSGTVRVCVIPESFEGIFSNLVDRLAELMLDKEESVPHMCHETNAHICFLLYVHAAEASSLRSPPLLSYPTSVN
jgi:hypothetical protein